MKTNRYVTLALALAAGIFGQSRAEAAGRRGPELAVPLSVYLDAVGRIDSGLLAVHSLLLQGHNPERSSLHLTLYEIVDGEPFFLAEQTVRVDKLTVVDPELTPQYTAVLVAWDPPTGILLANTEVIACAQVVANAPENTEILLGPVSCQELIPQ